MIAESSSESISQTESEEDEDDGVDIAAPSHTNMDSTTLGAKDLPTTLRNMPLFNVPLLQEELRSLKVTALIIPSKYRCPSRTTFTSDVGGKASASPLPVTSGPTLVEAMIHFGELSYWITQKQERLQMYIAFPQGRFYQTLLQLGPYFDLAELKNLFKNRSSNIGAGICTRKLIDAVEDFVVKAANPSNAGQQFMFDAREILGDR